MNRFLPDTEPQIDYILQILVLLEALIVGPMSLALSYP